MGNLKAKYDQIISERKDKIEKINILEKDEKVKQYLLLCKQNKKLANEQADLYKQMKIEEYSSCNHIWVNTLHSYDSFEGRSYDYCGCVKCGLDRRVFYLKERYHNNAWLNLDEKIMYDFMLNNPSRYSGINTNLLCHLDLGKAIYTKIKENNPGIDDETAVHYLKNAFNHIRNIKVSSERQVSRAKRLLLKSDYNKWVSRDVEEY